MKSWRIVVVGLVVASLWSGPVYAQPRRGMGWAGPRMMLSAVLKGVDLTPEQKARVNEITQAHRPTFRALVDQLQAAQRELSDKLFAPGAVQTEDLSPQIQRIGQLREQLFQEGLKVALEVRGVLTPEQLAKAAQLKDRIQALGDEMRSLLPDNR